MEENLDFTNGFIQNNPWPIPNKTLIIAEIGINHNGDIAIAKKLIDMAKNAGCDYVKFQKRTIDIVYPKDILDSYRESPWGNTQREQKEALEFNKEQYDEINSYCKEKSIGWFASAWDIPSQLFLKEYNFKYNKIASPMITHIDLLKMVAEEKKLTFISTGMSTYDDIDKAVDIFKKNDCPFILNHCVSEYPIAEDKINLKGMTNLRERYNCHIGYSGHEVTMIPCVLAAMMGAVVIERHITLDRAMYGSDQAASLEKRGLEMMCGYIKSIPSIIGNGNKTITPGEKANSDKLRYWGPFHDEHIN